MCVCAPVGQAVQTGVDVLVVVISLLVVQGAFILKADQSLSEFD